MKSIKSIILASGSPRRKELLEKAGIKFKIVESNHREYFDPKLTPHQLVKKLSLEKAKAVFNKYKNSIIIAADTIVVCKEKILGKPHTEEKAKEMLGILNGKMHYVITGFTVYDTEKNKFVTKSAKSRVYFNKISKQEINNYVISKKPLDKAGGYGIQELPKTFIRKTEGDYTNIVGLPICSLMEELKKLNIK